MIRIEIDNRAALSALKTPDIKGRVRSAVQKVTAAGKSKAVSAINSRYTAKNALRLGKMRSRVRGLSGFIEFRGARNELRHFILTPSTRPPHRPPGGLFVQVVAGQGGFLPHAFLGRKTVFEREGKDRLPIKHLNTVALPGMAKAVSSQIMSAIENRLEQELNEVMSGLI